MYYVVYWVLKNELFKMGTALGSFCIMSENK